MVKKIKFLIAMMVFTVSSAMAQLTTSSMAGKVAANGEELIGAVVEAVHTPSGTRYTTVSNEKGMFAINGMRVGGPYEVAVKYIGYETKTFTGITLELGETYNLNASMSEDAVQLADVVVTAQATKFTTEKTGASTIGRCKIGRAHV